MGRSTCIDNQVVSRPIHFRILKSKIHFFKICNFDFSLTKLKSSAFCPSFLDTGNRNQETEIRNLESEIRIQKSEVRNQKSEIWNQKSGIRNQESGIKNQESEIRNEE